MSGSGGKRKKKVIEQQINEQQTNDYRALTLFTLERLQMMGSPDESSQFFAMLIAMVVYSSKGVGGTTLSGDAKDFMEGLTKMVVESLTEMEKRGHGR